MGQRLQTAAAETQQPGEFALYLSSPKSKRKPFSPCNRGNDMQRERKVLGSACASQRPQGRRAAERKKARRGPLHPGARLTVFGRSLMFVDMHVSRYAQQDRVFGPRSSSPVVVERVLHHEHPYILKQGLGSPRVRLDGLDWLSCSSSMHGFPFLKKLLPNFCSLFNHRMGRLERLWETRQRLSRLSGEKLKETSREIACLLFLFFSFAK